MNVGDYKQAIECFTIAIAGDKDGINRLTSVYYFQRGFSYNKVQQYQKAIEDYTKAIQLCDTDASNDFS